MEINEIYCFRFKFAHKIIDDFGVKYYRGYCNWHKPIQ